MIDISCIQVEINILLNTFWSWSARTCLDCKNKGLFGFIWATFQLLVKKHLYQRFECFKVASKSQLKLGWSNIGRFGEKYNFSSYFATQNGFKRNWGHLSISR